jgi:hypothetical protein
VQITRAEFSRLNKDLASWRLLPDRATFLCTALKHSIRAHTPAQSLSSRAPARSLKDPAVRSPSILRASRLTFTLLECLFDLSSLLRLATSLRPRPRLPPAPRRVALAAATVLAGQRDARPEPPSPHATARSGRRWFRGRQAIQTRMTAQEGLASLNRAPACASVPPGRAGCTSFL